MSSVEKVKTNNMDFVLDKSGMSLNGVPIVLYAPANVDFTNEIIAALNKPGRAPPLTQSLRGESVPDGSKSHRNPKFNFDNLNTRGLNPRVFFRTGEITRGIAMVGAARTAENVFSIRLPNNECATTILLAALHQLARSAIGSQRSRNSRLEIFQSFGPLRASYRFGWAGLTAATGEVHFTAPSEDKFQLDATGQTIGFVRALWKLDAIYRGVADSQTLRPIESQQTENYRKKSSSPILLSQIRV